MRGSWPPWPAGRGPGYARCTRRSDRRAFLGLSHLSQCVAHWRRAGASASFEAPSCCA
jgi:hypothetical protein